VLTFAEISEVKKAEASLRESERRFADIADSSHALVWMSGLDKACFWFNKTWLDFTGRTMEQEAGNGWAEGVHPDDFDRCLSVYTSAFDRREPFSMDYRLRRADGEYRLLEDRGYPRFDADSKFLGYVGSCIDVTEERRLKADLAAAEERVARLERLLAAAREGSLGGVPRGDPAGGRA
jgi:PAS domain S-box-containing protein